jgi:hypothetical protein
VFGFRVGVGYNFKFWVGNLGVKVLYLLYKWIFGREKFTTQCVCTTRLEAIDIK